MQDTVAEHDVDYDYMRTLCVVTPSVKSIVACLAASPDDGSVTEVNSLLRDLLKRGEPLTRMWVVGAFRFFEQARFGRFVSGRRGHPSRFQWSVSKIAACGEVMTRVDELTPIFQSADPVSTPTAVQRPLVSHSFVLRPGLAVAFSLPVDLSATEAARLSDFVKTLPFD